MRIALPCSARPAVGCASAAPPPPAARPPLRRTPAAGSHLADRQPASAAAERGDTAAAGAADDVEATPVLASKPAPALASKPARQFVAARAAEVKVTYARRKEEEEEEEEEDEEEESRAAPPPPASRRATAAAPRTPQLGAVPFQVTASPGSAVVLAGQRFDSLLHLRHEMRALQRRLLGEEEEEVAVLPSSPHFALIQAVFRLHPHYAQKVHEPITSFFVVRNPFVLGGRGCEFQFEDCRGVRDDFSLLKCTRPPHKPTRGRHLLEACAHEVEPQLRAAAAEAAEAQRWRREEYGESDDEGGGGGGAAALRCCRCGSSFKVSVAYSGWHLSKLVHGFRETDAPSRAPIRFAVHPQTRQACFTNDPADAAWAAAWRAYHQRHARLEMLCKCCAGAQADARRARRWEAQHAGQRSHRSTPAHRFGHGAS